MELVRLVAGAYAFPPLLVVAESVVVCSQLFLASTCVSSEAVFPLEVRLYDKPALPFAGVRLPIRQDISF